MDTTHGDDEEAMDVDADDPVTVSYGEMGRLVRQLHSLGTGGISLPDGVSDGEDIQTFKNNLEELCTKLKNLSEVENPSFTAKCWMEEARNLCYDTEDNFDKVMHSGAGLGESVPPFNRFAADFSLLKSRAKGAEDRYDRCRLEETAKTNCQETSSSEQRPLLAEPSSVLSVDDHLIMDDIVKLLAFNNNEQLKVVSILGAAGLGKTTLARSLYHKFGARFECCAFVRISRNPDIRRFLISILSQTKGPRYHASSDAQGLFDSTKKHLRDKRYLIIIDDLWALTTWDIISRALPRDNGYSRIITTTETGDVALACCSYNSTHIFKMRPRNDLQCNGLPCETIMEANLLACNPNVVPQWVRLQKSRDSSSLHSSSRTKPPTEIGDTKGRTKQGHVGTFGTYDGTKELLNLIYGVLPHNLKTCLLYLNMYPEDYTIKKEDLVKQWVAEGFLGEINRQDRGKVAEGYFDELINRGLIQEMDTNYNNEVLSCTVHHIVLDFTRYKRKEENFITIVDYFQTTPGNPDRVRRLSVQFGGAKGANIPASVKMDQLRSLIYFGFFKCVPPVLQYDLLRVLILHFWADKDEDLDLSSIDKDEGFNLSNISKLFRLRYLKIVCNVRVKLPAEIGRLQYLETLDLDTRVVGFPSDIAHLEKLLHLRLPREANMPHGIDKMTSLCSLAYFQLSEDNVLDLGKLTNLQDLHLTCSGVQNDRVAVNMECLWSIMDKFSKLKSLIVEGDALPVEKDADASATSIPVDGLSIVSCPPPHLQKLELSSKSYIFSSLPEWIAQLSKLSILKIAVRDLLRNNIQILNRLTALTVLSLYVWNAPAGGFFFNEEFQNLKYFKFKCTAPCLKFVKGAMVKVEKLKLCFNADSIEQYDLTLVGFQYLTSLKEISVKFGDPNSSNIGNAESALVDAVSKHPGEPILNVEPKEEIFYGDQEKNVSAQKQNPQIPERQVTIADRDSGDQRVQQKKRKHTAVENEETQILMGQNVVEGKVTGKQHEDRQNTASEDTVIQEDRCQTSHIERTTLKPPESSFPTQKIDMQAFGHHHFAHPQHLLLKTRYDSTSRHICDICQVKLSGLVGYRCEACDFDIHEACAEYFRETISFFAHTWHTLTLTYSYMPPENINNVCDLCVEKCARGQMVYRCTQCDFDVHPLCTLLPQTIRSNLHPQHDLNMVPGTGRCAVCHEDLHVWHYRCGCCSYMVHIGCVSGNDSTTGPSNRSSSAQRERKNWVAKFLGKTSFMIAINVATGGLALPVLDVLLKAATD